MQQSSRHMRCEVRLFINASAELYEVLSRGAALNGHERETIRCCLEELAAKETEVSRAGYEGLPIQGYAL